MASGRGLRELVCGPSYDDNSLILRKTTKLEARSASAKAVISGPFHGAPFVGRTEWPPPWVQAATAPTPGFQAGRSHEEKRRCTR